MASHAHAFPPAVAALLKAHSSAEASVDAATGLAWAFSRRELLVWRWSEGRSAAVVTRTLPYLSSRHHFVALIGHEVRAGPSPVAKVHMHGPPPLPAMQV